jgi:CheY-like chemotaxis protein
MPRRILVVDDEPDNNKVLEAEENGFEVDCYADPLCALEKFKPNIYDLLLLDIKMSKMDGFQLSKEMKKIDNKVKTCFLTACEIYYEQFRRGEEFAAWSKDLFLRKPIQNDELILQVKRIIDYGQNSI